MFYVSTSGTFLFYASMSRNPMFYVSASEILLLYTSASETFLFYVNSSANSIFHSSQRHFGFMSLHQGIQCLTSMHWRHSKQRSIWASHTIQKINVSTLLAQLNNVKFMSYPLLV